VRVEVSTFPGVDGAFRRVVNSGQVLDPAIVPSLFEPFRRQGGERLSRDRGLGLGPSIVTAVVAAHHGQCQARARPDGGLDIEIRLPPPDYLTATRSMTKTSVSLGPTGPLP
jgi:signal transduction histidine kinase